MKIDFVSSELKGNTRKVLAGAFGLLLALALIAGLTAPVLAVPQAPHQFWGEVAFDGVPAPAGTPISAQIGGVEYASTVVDDLGRYGYDPAFYVPADDPDTPDKDGGVSGDTVEFYVLGALVGTAPFAIGGYTELDLALPAPVYTLTIDSTAGGSVTAPGEGTFFYYEGTVVDLVATPDAGYRFVNWTGDVGTVADPDAATTTITMNGDYAITANFIRTYDLTVDSTAGGSVTTPGEGTFTYDEGEVVDLVATPDVGFVFVNWTGDVGTVANPDAAATTITMDGDYAITANFTAVPGAIMFIDIGAGWQTFSVPIALHPDFDTWGELVAQAGLDVEIAYYFDGLSQTWGLVQASYPVLPCDAIYVKMASAGTVPIVPNPEQTAPATKELYPDWNLVGLANLEDMGVVDALASVYLVTGDLTGYIQVLSPAINAPNDWVYVRDGEGNPLMVVGKGYWVFMINGGTLAGFTSTPLP